MPKSDWIRLRHMLDAAREAIRSEATVLRVPTGRSLQNCEDTARGEADADRQHQQRCGGGSGEAPA